MNLFDMMAQAGERERLIAQGRMLGLTDEQAKLVVDTLGPAAMAGLQRAQETVQADAGAVMRGMTEMGTRMMRDGAGAQVFDASPAARVFGSPQAAEAVADQIARMTGADAQAMRQLVPAFSASLLAQMAVLASLPALAPMKEALQQAMAAMPSPAPKPAPSAASAGSARAPDAADMMAPVTQFMQGLSAMMGSALQPSKPEPSGSEAPAAPSLADAVDAQTRAWNAFLEGLAKVGETGETDTKPGGSNG